LGAKRRPIKKIERDGDKALDGRGFLYLSNNQPKDGVRLRLFSDTRIAGKLNFLAPFLFCFLRLFKFISRLENNHGSGLVADSWICVVTRTSGGR